MAFRGIQIGFLKRWPVARSVLVIVLLAHIAAVGTILWRATQSHDAHTRHGTVRALALSIDGLAAGLSAIDLDDQSLIQTTVVNYNSTGVFDSLRGVDSNGRIICSTRREEIGTDHWQAARLGAQWPAELTWSWEHRDDPMLERVTVRCPVPVLTPRKWMLEAVVSGTALAATTASGDVWAVAIGVLAVLVTAALCWILHSYIRPLASIGTNLVSHQNTLEEELSSLRLASEAGWVASSWNQLISLFEEMRESLGQNTAYRELSHALERNASTEFVDATDVIPEGIIHLVDGVRVGYINSMACRLLGMDVSGSEGPRAYRGQTIDELPVSEAGAEYTAQLRDGLQEGGQFEARSVRIEGASGRTFRIKILPVVANDRKGGAVILISDVSQLARAEKAREAFVNQVTHELRTPLTNIRAYTETLGEIDDPEIQKECFNVIQKETRRLSRLVEEMLSQSQIDLGTMHIRCDNVNLLELLNEAVRDLRATAEVKEVEISAELPSKLPTLHADRDKIAVVVNNLLGNALKYTPSGGAVVVGCTLAGDRVKISFKDTGIGIDEEHHEKIFEQMYRVDCEEVRQEVGSGVGLYTAREIIRQHGGDIRVISTKGHGSEFVVDVPIKARTLGGTTQPA